MKFFCKSLVYFSLLIFLFLLWGKVSVAYAWVPGGAHGTVYMRDPENNLIPLGGVKINREDYWGFYYCGGGSCFGYNDTVESLSHYSDAHYDMDNWNNIPGPVASCPPTEHGAYICPAGPLGNVQDRGCGGNWCGYNCGSNPHRWKAYFPSGYTLPGNYSTTIGHWEAPGGCGHAGASWGSYAHNAYYQANFNNYQDKWNCNFIWVPEAMNVLGWLDAANCDYFAGWAGDTDVSNQAIDVHFYADGPAGSGKWIGSTTANKWRESAVCSAIRGSNCGACAGAGTACVQSGLGQCNHGFCYSPIPEWLKDGKNHTIYAHGINAPGTPGTNPLLFGVPKTINCPISAQPEIREMKVTSGPTDCPGCKAGYSGLQQVEQGANWYNHMTISQEVVETAGTASDINFIVAAFVPNAVSATKPSDGLNAVLSQANDGFVIAYSHNSHSYGGFNFAAGHYYVYYNNSWIGTPLSSVVRFPEVNPKFAVEVTNPALVQSNSLTAKWNVYLWQVFESKSLKTYAYARDKLGKEGFMETMKEGLTTPSMLLQRPSISILDNLLALTRSFWARINGF